MSYFIVKMREKNKKKVPQRIRRGRVPQNVLSVPLAEESFLKEAKTGESCILCFHTIKSSPGLWNSYLKQFRKMQLVDSVDINALCSSALGIFSKFNIDDLLPLSDYPKLFYSSFLNLLMN